MPKEKYIQVCPKCKSTDISRDTSNILEGVAGLPSKYICHNCNHTGLVFPEVAMSEIEGFMEKAEKKGLKKTKKKEVAETDINYGKFVVRVIWKIVGPFLLLMGTIFLFYKSYIGLIPLLPGLIITYIAYFNKKRLKD